MIKQGIFYNVSGVAIALARQHGVNQDETVRTRFLEHLDKTMDDTGPGEDLVKILDDFYKRKFQLGIVTFQRRPRLERRLKTWHLNGYFMTLVTPEQHTDFKPSPEPFLAGVKQLGLPADQCFVIGDEPVDMMGGKKAGAGTVGLPQGFFSEEELKEAGADSIINSLTALPQIV